MSVWVGKGVSVGVDVGVLVGRAVSVGVGVGKGVSVGVDEGTTVGEGKGVNVDVIVGTALARAGWPVAVTTITTGVEVFEVWNEQEHKTKDRTNRTAINFFILSSSSFIL